jgi:Primase C terminal 2 (PriCT-2)
MNNIRTHLMHVTYFKDARAAVACDQVRSLPEIVVDVLGASAATKKGLPWIKMARFGRIRSEGGSLRNNANVRAFSGIETDYDGKVVSFRQACKLLRKLRCRALIYTSPSHTEAEPKWRILLPTSQEIWKPDIRRVLVGRVDGFFGNIFAKESYTLSQAYYFGAALDNPAPDHQAVIVDGDYVDLRHDLARFDEPEPPPPDAEMVAAMIRDVGKGVSSRPEDNATYAPISADDLEQEMRAALTVIPSDDYHDWIKVGAAIRDGLGDAGGALFHEWSQGSSKYDERECAKKWERQIPRISRVTVNTIFWLADQRDPEWRDLYRRARAAGVQL